MVGSKPKTFTSPKVQRKSKNKRRSHVLPREVKSEAREGCIEGNAFDIVKKTETDKGCKRS